MTDLFNDSPNDKAQDSAAPAPVSTAKPQPTMKAAKGKKKYATSDYLWMAGLVLGGAAVLYWLNAPDSASTANSTGQGIQPRQSAAASAQQNDTGAASSSFREEISGAIMKQNERINQIDNTSKQGMTILSNQLKSANNEIASLKEKIRRLELNYSSNGNATVNAGANSYNFNQQPQKLLKEFSINDLSNDLAWVKYKNQVYAVRNGSVLGGVTVTGIDMNQRLVETDKGLIR
ncbi:MULTISPECIES: TraP [Enterobacterales]|uniref:TraP n=1 Tax=Enterobacterales TaxID=91347 RepID=UPI000CECB587|nr:MULTISPECIES: TraP [Enterobacterales]ROC77480.1 TraP [Enterobacter hormaechei subsp. steigerwaltii]